MRLVQLNYPYKDLSELRNAIEHAYLNEENRLYKGRLLQLLNEISKKVIEGEK